MSQTRQRSRAHGGGRLGGARARASEGGRKEPDPERLRGLVTATAAGQIAASSPAFGRSGWSPCRPCTPGSRERPQESGVEFEADQRVTAAIQRLPSSVETIFLCREDEDVAANRRSNDSAPSSFTTDRSPSGARPPELNAAAVRQTCGAARLIFWTALRLLSPYAGAIAQVLPPELKTPPVSIRLSIYVMGLVITGSAPPQKRFHA